MSQTTTTPQAAPGIGGYLTKHMRDYGLLLALIAIMVFFQIVTDGTLLRPVNITNLFLQNSYIIIMALGMLMVIVSGHIDLSVGSVMGFIGAFAAVLIVTWGLPVAVAVPLCLIAGMAIGAVQGYFIAYWKIPSFIVTLAGMLVFRGLSLWLLEGQSVGPFPRSFQLLSTGFVPDIFGIGKPNAVALAAGVIASAVMIWTGLRARASNARYGIEDEPSGLFWLRNLIVAAALLFVTWKLAWFRGLPNVLISMVILTVIYVFLTERTTIGRRIYAVGGNEKAAKLSGIRTERLTFLAFVNMGLLAALAGLVFAARLNTATPKAGFGVELDVIAAVFIGGASMSGGSGKVIGAVVGAFIMGVMNNGMSILGIGIDYQQVIKGLVLLAAVFFDVYNKRKEG
ncbi:sugar ABC transporter permease [Paracoccus sp. DMF-8]|uniref:multiple monosaccharide ABC transporter permease n=1 Tax=Paracoccus sp. DMF-8 TaxID=3019445 RepID=UPI0023E7F859|nr:multiple monosaccharide ABC transporter permease [Paracoccus sp. DMF-8]MDF3606264.1 sugar ABC transporter permease [Paracoccus sp. DMF-8]